MTRGRVIPFDEARRLKRGNPRARWPGVVDDFAGEVWPGVSPSFRIRPGQTIFTIGSCFARNVERHLEALGCRTPMLDLVLPAHEWGGRENGAMNKFHPPAFRQSLEWTAAIRDRDGRVTWADCEALAFEFADGRLFDMDMGATAPVTKARFTERRQAVYDVFATAFEADGLMMTPGFIEAWRDRETGLYIHEAPTQKAMLGDRSRWEFEVLSYEQCLADLLGAIDVVRARNPGVKVLITTSPVPMAATFTGQDIRIANSYSKAVLRAVCGAASQQRPLVDYFPSYESATLTNPAMVWAEDRIHVAAPFIGKIVRHMLDHYIEGVGESARRHQLAQTLLSGGAFDEAEASARAALAADPGAVEARVVLAEALLRQHRCDDAEVELRALLEDHPDRADLWTALARTVSRRNDARAGDAVGHIETAAALPSMSLADFRGVAGIIRRRAAPEAALRLARRAVELYPTHVEAYPLLVDVLSDQGRASEAIEVLGSAVGLRRAPAAMRLQLAELLGQAGQLDRAVQALEPVLGQDPKNEAAARLLAKLRAAQVPTA
jgi:tetratricopeptide (TPR) repeat protein